MSREEAIEKIDRYFNWVNNEGPFHVPQEILNALHELKQPPTLADFLGWEENVDYDVTGLDTNIFFVDDIPQRYKKIAKIGSDGYSFHVKAYNHDLAFHTDERINRLRQTKKADPEKYYANIILK